ncbi:MAG TPA: TetR/AcrR family transcriptional regulator [Planctomycetota bacterium]|nr:TetR/AcrR family transcriptional regulator [Planctomycetota bacterium]
MVTDRKAEIRRRAAEVFAGQGFDRASIRDVAKATGLSLAGLYYYYKGKEEILFDIQREAFTTLLDAHAAALAGVRDPEQKLRRVVDAHLAFFAGHIAEMKVMSRESEQLQGEYAGQVDELKRRYVRLVRGIVEELQPRPEAPAGVAAFLLFGMMNWVYTWYDEKRDGSPADIARAAQEIFLRGVR